MTVAVDVRPDPERNGGWILSAGAHPFEVGLRVRPVGTLEFDESTHKLLKMFAPAYCDDLIALLVKAREIEGD